MEESPKPPNKTKKLLLLVLKIVVTGLCLWYVSGKIDFSKAGTALRNANHSYLLLALAAFAASKVFAALRLNIYFRNIGITLTESQNLKLYWLGMFYNLFLPGSISGDAYKVIRLTKKYGVPYKKTTAAVLLDRVSGLLGLGLLLAIYGVVALGGGSIAIIIIVFAIVGVVALLLINKYWLKDFLPSFWITLYWGIGVQAMQIVCVYLIMLALGISIYETAYIFLFLISSMVSVLPLTIGGLGAREIVFLEGSKYFNLPGEYSVIISILFYLITLVTSAIGAYYVFNDPLKMKKDPGMSP
ncbi:MAG: flippase-like domain-containing protein [Chitinophagaceae bacterium]|nr:flippase-like domain-containing protein [Chitinophagaceae bacterium]